MKYQMVFRKSWARLIQKIYEVDPLICPKCKGAMRIISFIEDAQVIREITLLESTASVSYTHPPHPHADAYADPEYSWDDYIQS